MLPSLSAQLPLLAGRQLSARGGASFHEYDSIPCRHEPIAASDPALPSWEKCFKRVPGQFQGQAVYDAVIERVLMKEPEREHLVLEVGALMGQSSCYMSHRLQEMAKVHHVSAKFTIVDIWAPVKYYQWLQYYHFYSEWETLVKLAQGENAPTIRPVWEHLMCKSGATAGITSHIQGSSMDGAIAALFADASLSFIYLDTSHQYNETMAELTLWWPKLRPGGWFCGDDFSSAFPVPAAVHDWKKKTRIKDHVEVWPSKPGSEYTTANEQFCIGKGVPAKHEI